MIFLVLPENAGKPRRLTVNRRTLRIAGICALVAGLALAWVLFDYVDVKLERLRLVAELDTMQVERDALLGRSTDQERQIGSLSGEIDQLAGEVQQMARLDASLRQVTNLAAPDSGALMTGGISKPALGGRTAVATAAPGPDGMHLRVEDLLGDARSVRANLAELNAYFADRSGGFAAMPSVWPVRGWVSSEFGMRTDPLTSQPAMHEGLDIATAAGTPIVAPAGGLISFVGAWGGYGTTVLIQHGQGISTLYGHLSAALVQPGAKVRRGEPIALVGSTGRSTGPHLHYEVQLNGVPINPRLYILD